MAQIGLRHLEVLINFNVGQTEERQEMNKYFSMAGAGGDGGTGSGEPPKKPPAKPVGG